MYQWTNAQHMADFIVLADGPVSCYYKCARVTGGPEPIGASFRFIDSIGGRKLVH